MKEQSMPRFPRPFRNNRGFTLVEMVVTVAVMAILIGISTPAIFEFMRQRDRQREEIAQNEIIKAMKAYLADNGNLPADTATGANIWYTKLASYTNLSANEIANDVWKRPRTYLLYTSTGRKLFGTTVNIYYATIFSKGLNGKAENTYLDSAKNTVTVSGIALSGTDFAGAANTSWWKALGADETAKITAFSALQPGGDDHLTRFTNYSEMLDRYNVTVDRLDRLTQALETYARTGYAGRVSWCLDSANATNAKCINGAPEQTVYYPKSSPKDTAYPDAATYADTTVYVNNTGTDTARRTGMQNLMNVLGLPIEFCCSAMENSTTDDLPLPFFYFSNPRARDTSASPPCAARPTATQGKLPARITTKSDTTTCG